jgi:hypothetical protein
MPTVLVFFLIVTLFGGIGYQLRRWLGKQRWYVGVAFVLILYLPAFLAVLVGLMLLGAPFESARRVAASPTLSGLITGALCLCAPDSWMPEASEEAHEAKDEELPDASSLHDEQETDKESLHSSSQTWGLAAALFGALFLTSVVVIFMRAGSPISEDATSHAPGQSIDTREVQVDLVGVPSTAMLEVPETFSPTSSAFEETKERLILSAGKSNKARLTTYSKVLARDWTTELMQMTTLSIGQLKRLVRHQGEITRNQWQAILEKATEGMSDPEFRRRIDSLQSRIEDEAGSSFDASSPAVTVRNESLIVYKTVQAQVDNRLVQQLRARKQMYDAGYIVIADVSVTVGEGPPADSLRSYMRAISFSAE